MPILILIIMQFLLYLSIGISIYPLQYGYIVTERGAKNLICKSTLVSVRQYRYILISLVLTSIPILASMGTSLHFT